MAERRIVLPYAPRSVFRFYHDRSQRWACLVAHRRCGKTVACINDMIKQAIMCPLDHGRYAYVAPFLSQAKEVAWEYLKRFAQPIVADKNESELWVELLNGARIRIHGADNPDRLRGAYLDGVVLDEYADMRPSVWGEVIRPMLADRQGWATFIGTPKGRNEFYGVWHRAEMSTDWFAGMLRASATGILPESELSDAKRDMTPEQYAQEFECSFEAAILGAYYGKEIAELERQGRIREVKPDALLPIHTAWDLGIDDPTAIWAFQISHDGLRIVGHYENHGQAIPHYVAEIAARGWTGGVDWVPHDARVRSLETGRTRLETLKALGREPRVVPEHKVMDGINGARLTLPHCYFDAEGCREGLEALRQYRADYDEKIKTFKPTPKHDWSSHTADAFRYLAMAWRSLQPEEPPPQNFVERLIAPRTIADIEAEFQAEQEWD